MTENPLLKDMFNMDTVQTLGNALATEYPVFPTKTFIQDVFDDSWEKLELKARVRHITQIIGILLPSDYPEALKILRSTLPHLTEQGFEKMVFPDFVEVYGLEDWPTSMDALEEFTKHVSGEFAIRPFIARYPNQTLNRMLKWAEHPHPGVRRLASEGCRPRLPWGLRLKDLVADPSPVLPILEKLKDDNREEIRRSVANNINDISKDHPDLAVKILTDWQDPEKINRTRLIKHALRSLIKAGHPGALGLLGFSSEPEIKIKNIRLEPEQIKLGGEVQFSFEIHSKSNEEQKLMVDYMVHFLKASGKHSPKVFKLKQITLQPGEKITINRKHGIKPITTRKYYPGIQYFQPQVNGKKFGRVKMNLEL
jgi:3-methyladenine DNA glycosylase AlkC